MNTDPPPSAGRFGKAMLVAAWVIALVLVTWTITGWLEHSYNPNQRVMGIVGDDGMREVVLEQNRMGHYVANGSINGQPVVFLLDTGATAISVPASLAPRLGLEPGAPQAAHTAGGRVITYAVVLDEVALGGVRLGGVRAHINPHMSGEEVLLGMTFLRHLEFVQQGRKLTLRQHPDG